MNAQNAELNPVLHDLRDHDRLMLNQSGLRAWKVRQAAKSGLFSLRFNWAGA